MNQYNLRKMPYLIFILIVGFLGGFLVTRCATPQKELKTYPLTEINPEKVFKENRGLKVIKENATMNHDYYRGGVQEKDEGEALMKEGKWEEARKHFEESNRYLQVVVKYQRQDEPSLNVYGDVMVIFVPNLLMADNNLKLITIYKNAKDDNKAAEAKSNGEYYLSKSLQSVNTEWANQIKKGLENAFPKK